jgi:5-methylcytosine-specific restriction endonuclease McrA
MATTTGHTPGKITFQCKGCGWQGEVSGRPRCLACYAKRAAEWRAANPEKNLALKRRMDKKARTERPGQAAARKRKKRSKNPEHYRAKWAERSAWLKAGDVTREQLQKIRSAAGGKCKYCGVIGFGVRLNPTDPRGFDHVVPRSKGGLHTAANLVLCCGPCNSKRSDHV